jgi:DUF3096 family protein
LAAPLGQLCPFQAHELAANRISVHMCHANTECDRMNVHLDISLLQPMIALIAGILILVVPRLLNFVVAIYLILLGVSGLWPHLLR